jgi:hypothetical protein
MPERVTIEENLRIIHVDSYGDVTAKDLQGSIKAVARINKEHGFTKVFVDATKETSLPSTFHSFDIGSQLANAVRLLRVAVLGSTRLKKNLTFIETVAHNRGALVKVFYSRKDAMAWLMELPNNSMHVTPNGAPDG